MNNNKVTDNGRVFKQCIIAISMIAIILLSLFIEIPVNAAKNLESTVTYQMCRADYWKKKANVDINKVLADKNEIARYNANAISSKDCNMYDLENMTGSYDSTELKKKLAYSIVNEVPSKNIYVGDKIIDRFSYYQNIANLISINGWEGTTYPKYAVATNQTQIKSIPTPAFVGYSKTDSDDEIILGALRVNEPFVIKQLVTVDNLLFYYGYSNNVAGWVIADDLAICKDREEWLNAWKMGLDAEDFIVVTGDYFTLSKSKYSPLSSELKLTMGTTLKLVPDDMIPENIAQRGAWNNYVVYVPTRDISGNYQKQIALVAYNKPVNIGYMDLTSSNMLDIAFSAIGDTYGWGGMLDSVDCSLYVRNIYKCFGYEMPRNTNWQLYVSNTKTDVSEQASLAKSSNLSKLMPGTPLYMKGHTMIYVGSENGRNYVISAAGAMADSAEGSKVVTQNSVVVNPLTVKRANGSTWLDNINSFVEPWKL